jgi:hypothetical protein
MIQASATTYLPQYIDNTMMVTFRGCPEKFKNEFIFGLRPADVSIDLHAGAAFSATLERFYREYWAITNRDFDLALARSYATFTHEWGDFEILNPNNPKTPDAMWEAVEKYLHEYPPASESCQPYLPASGGAAPSFEFSFAIPLDMPGFPVHPVSGDPFIYTGRFDMFAAWEGLPAVRDEKTAARLESNWANKWDLRSQFLGYCWALQHYGIKCNTVVVRGVIIRKVAGIALVEAVKQYPQFLIDRWFEQLRRDLTRLVASYKEGFFDMNMGDTCTAYSHCPFVPLCTSSKPEMWYDSYSKKRWNPLLRNPMADAPGEIALNFATKNSIRERFADLLPKEYFTP